MYSKTSTMKSISTYCDKLALLKRNLTAAKTIVIGAGAGLSTSAGLTYSGERFEKHFASFIKKYGFQEMYSGGFYPFDTLEEYWAYWSRYVYVNRYLDAPRHVYDDLLKLVQNKDYFVLTTNVDHCFQKAGFDEARVFCTQGDYGLWQCSRPCHKKTYDNEITIRKMLIQQKDMKIPSDLVPYCPNCGAPMSMNLRIDQTFVEDENWQKAAERYQTFIHEHQGLPVLYLELGVGDNTPGIIKYPFWKMTYQNPNSVYVAINLFEPYCPPEIRHRAICIGEDIGDTLKHLLA